MKLRRTIAASALRTGATAAVVCRRANPLHLTVLVLAAVTLAAPGCMKSQALPAGRMDQEYQLSSDRWATAETPELKVGGITVPTGLVLTEERDLFASVMDIMAARERLDAGQSAFRLLIADQLADRLAEVLREMARRTKDWGESAEDYARPWGRQDWAADTAGILALLYRLDRGGAVADPRESLQPTQSQLVSLAPVLRSLVLVLMKRMEINADDAGLLAGLESQRSLPIEFVLRGAFRLARLQMPPEAPDQVQTLFDHGPPTAVGVENVLRQKLLDLRAEAERGPRLTQNKRIEQLLKAVPIALSNLARGIEQWDKFYLASIQVGTSGGHEMVSLVADVQPGQVVRIDQLHEMAPLLTFEGRTRINISESPASAADGAERISFRFLSERGGQVCVRFESWVYGLAGLLTFPIEDWVLDEMIVSRARPERHRRDTDYVLLMRTRQWKEGDDRRRVMHIHIVRTLEVAPRDEAVERRVRTDLRFEFSRPDRLWYHDRTSYSTLPKP